MENSFGQRAWPTMMECLSPTADWSCCLAMSNSLQDVERTGYVMSGIEHPEDVAAHSFGVAAAALLIVFKHKNNIERLARGTEARLGSRER